RGSLGRHPLERGTRQSAADHAGNADFHLAHGAGDHAAQSQRRLANHSPPLIATGGGWALRFELVDCRHRILAHAGELERLGRVDDLLQHDARIFVLVVERGLSVSSSSLSREALVARDSLAMLPIVRRSTLFWSFAQASTEMMRMMGSREPVAK